MTKKYHAYTRPITSSKPILGANDLYSSFTTYNNKQGIEICINHIDIVRFYIDPNPRPNKFTFNSFSSLVDTINYSATKTSPHCVAELSENSIHISSNWIFEIIDTNIKESLVKLMGIHYDEQDI